MDKLKKTLNNALSNFAQKIQVNTGSFLVWGEIKLPEEIRKEIEYKNINKEYINKIKNDILKNEEVLKIDKICAKPIGSKYILLIVLAINDSKNLKFTVEVLKRIKKSILYKYNDIKDVFIQIG